MTEAKTTPVKVPKEVLDDNGEVRVTFSSAGSQSVLKANDNVVRVPNEYVSEFVRAYKGAEVVETSRTSSSKES